MDPNVFKFFLMLSKYDFLEEKWKKYWLSHYVHMGNFCSLFLTILNSLESVLAKFSNFLHSGFSEVKVLQFLLRSGDRSIGSHSPSLIQSSVRVAYS